MEKYAIDIDKVLDEFEENEALKTNIFNPVTSLKKNCNTLDACKEKMLESSKNDETFSFSLNSESCDNYFSQIADKNLKQLLDGTSVSNSEIRVVSEEKILGNFQESPEKLSLYDNSKDSNLLNFDIFFKQLNFDNLEHVISTNNNPSTVLSTIPNETNNNVEEEILCVTVNEMKSDESSLVNAMEKSEICSLSESSDKSSECIDSIGTEIYSDTKNLNIRKDISVDKVLELSKLDSFSQISKQCVDNPIEISFPTSSSNSLLKKDTSILHEVINNFPHLNVNDSLKSLSFSVVGKDDLCSKEKNIKTETTVSVTEDSKVSAENQYTYDKHKTTSEECLSVNEEKVDDNKYCLPFDLETHRKEDCSNILSLDKIVPVENLVEQNFESCEENLPQKYTNPVVASEQIDSQVISIRENQLLLDATSLTEHSHVSTSITYTDCEADIYNNSKESPIIDKAGGSEISSRGVVNNNTIPEIPYQTSNSVDTNQPTSLNCDNATENQHLLNATSLTEQCHVSTSVTYTDCDADIYDNSKESSIINKAGDSGISSRGILNNSTLPEIPYHTSNSVDSKNCDNERVIIPESEPIKTYRDVVKRKTWKEETVVATGDYISYYISSPENVYGEKVSTPNVEGLKVTLPNEVLIGQNGSCFAATKPKIDQSHLKVMKKGDRLKCAGKKEKVMSPNFVSDNKLNIKTEAVLDNCFESVPNRTANNLTSSNIESNLCNSKNVASDAVSVYNNADDTFNLSENRKTGEHLYNLSRPTSLNLPAIEKYSPLQSANSELVKNVFPVTPTHRTINEVGKQQIGLVKPYWIPDSEAPNCMHCAIKFTVMRRRHHCRACGKVLCSRCCNQQVHLAYMNKEDRTCILCAKIITSSTDPKTIQNVQLPNSPDSVSSSGSNQNPSAPVSTSSKAEERPVRRIDPNNPEDYCSTISPIRQMELSGPNPTLFVWVPVDKTQDSTTLESENPNDGQ